jgi:NitT/TauT family transport system substrate-binding protein
MAGAQDLTKVIASSVVNDGGTAALYAVHAGLFRKAGLDVEIQIFSSGGAAAAAVLGGSAQFGFSSLTTLLTAFDHGVPITLVASAGVITPDVPYSQFVIAKDAPYKTGHDLNGKTIGTPALKDLDTVAVQNWVDKNGGDSSTLRFIEMPAAVAVASVEQGRIDGTELNTPTLTKALKGGKVRVLAQIFDAIAPRFLNTSWFTTNAYAKDHGDVVTRFSSVLSEAGKYCNAHQSETIGLVKQNAKLSDDDIAGMTRVVFADGLKTAEIQPVIDVSAKYKLISKRFDAATLISPLANL